MISKLKQGCYPHEKADLKKLIYKDSRLRGNSSGWLNNDVFIILFNNDRDVA